ncbi:MAG: hypothetical protein MPK10_07550, partial [Gammaproteobacteria bacterium]|nr:hypothetical protein [Gammaproteobacteria bacterium]
MPPAKKPPAPPRGETPAPGAPAPATTRGHAAPHHAPHHTQGTAIAWSLYKPQHAEALAELAVRTTGIGNAADKTRKNRRKTFGTLRDLLRVKTVGVIESDEARGLVKYGKPVGVVAAVTPSTNSAATPVHKAMMAVQSRHATLIPPSPAGAGTGTAGGAGVRPLPARPGARPRLGERFRAPGPAAKTL